MINQTFKDVLEVRNSMLHARSIYKELIEHLSKFLDSDAQKTVLGIKSEGEGGVVPQPLIVEAQEEIASKLAVIDRQLNSINISKVAENVESKRKQESETPAEETSKKGIKARKAIRIPR